ncbi:ankyrin [Cadophora sp. DSE1049]|nr:ankyrin [Cadophora sp. DSE1049]
MNLLGLSVELLMAVLEHTVQVVGLTESVKLRLVCSAYLSRNLFETRLSNWQVETFDREIPMAMCNTRILESQHRRTMFFPPNSWLVEEHIFRETWVKQDRNNNLPAAILLAAETLAPKTSKSLEFDKEQIVRKLCRAAALKLNMPDILSCLEPGAEQKVVHLRRRSTSNHIVSAAAYLGDLDFFVALIAQNQRIDSSENIYFGNPLCCAILQGHFDLVKFMLDHNVNVNQSVLGAGNGATALRAAASTGRQDLVNLLLEPRYNCNTSGEDLEDAVLGAASAGHLPIVQNLLQRFDADPPLEFLNKILFAGCRFGHDNIVLFALQLGSDPNKEGRFSDWQWPLSVAAERCHTPVIKTLLNNGAVLSIGGKYDTISKAGGRRRLSDEVVRALYEFAEPSNWARAVKFHEDCILHGHKSSIPIIECIQRLGLNRGDIKHQNESSEDRSD